MPAGPNWWTVDGLPEAKQRPHNKQGIFPNNINYAFKIIEINLKRRADVFQAISRADRIDPCLVLAFI